MLPKYWMISDRNIQKKGLGGKRAPLSCWVASKGPLKNFKNWKKLTANQMRAEILKATDGFPLIGDAEHHYDQKHLTLFIHGYNNDWEDAAARYESLCGKLFSGSSSLGICVLFSWPSNGMKTGYLPDRADARECAPDLAEILARFYDWLIRKQVEGAQDPDLACKAKVSVIAHSMGNYLLQKAMQLAWTRKNQPLLVSLINQLLMVAADVDNDVFKGGEGIDQSDGDAIANLTYRITALYSGRDPILGMSAGLKHFGKRRLGRSGLDKNFTVPDNVWDIDCSRSFGKKQDNIHSAYFEEKKTLDLMRELLRGIDRKVLMSSGYRS